MGNNAPIKILKLSPLLVFETHRVKIADKKVAKVPKTISNSPLPKKLEIKHPTVNPNIASGKSSGSKVKPSAKRS